MKTKYRQILILGLILVLTTFPGGCIAECMEKGGNREDIVSGRGTVIFNELEGGFYGIISDNGERYDPVNLSQEFQIDGLRVYFEAKILHGFVSIHMWGEIVEIIKIEVLAQTPIQGWDKAKFGMTPEDLKNTYSEEERYFKQTFKELESLEMGSLFWSVTEEDKFSDIPYTFSTSRLRVLGRKSYIYFSFVDNKLFRIQVLGTEDAIKEAPEFKLKLKELRDFLINKYGDFLEKEESKEKEALMWKDTKGNSLILEICFKHLYYVGEFYDFSSYKVTYSDKELTELWKKKVVERKEENRKIEERGMESF